ncbi:MAG TPA: hypothetical protein VN688_29590 [Gemmataceae bacterium]|nr:hypothetical protein [Gemmataceae bacterium]
MSDPPEQSDFCSLHERLLNGDRLASEELCRRVLSFLVAEVARKFPRSDEQLVSDGVIDAVLDYCSQPRQYDADAGVPLDRFLALAARRNVANLQCGEQRRKQRERRAGEKKREADVALDPLARNIQQEEREAMEQRRAVLLAALKTARDREILTLWLDGVKDNAAFATVLNVTHLPLDRQRVEVKRHKDRILRFLRRKGLLT